MERPGTWLGRLLGRQAPASTMRLQEQLERLGHRADQGHVSPLEHAIALLERFLEAQGAGQERNDTVAMHNLWWDVAQCAEAQRWQYEKALGREREGGIELSWQRRRRSTQS